MRYVWRGRGTISPTVLMQKKQESDLLEAAEETSCGGCGAQD